MIKTFTLFSESTFAKKSLFYDDFDYEKLYIGKYFIDDVEPLTDIYLERINKHIHLKWYNSETHKIKEKIEKRTPVHSITEFNDIVNKYIIILFTEHFDEIKIHLSNKEVNKIAIKIPELKAFIVIQYNPDFLFERFTPLTMISILPWLRGTSEINRIFYLK
jgi:hypothetical protein